MLLRQLDEDGKGYVPRNKDLYSQIKETFGYKNDNAVRSLISDYCRAGFGICLIYFDERAITYRSQESLLEGIFGGSKGDTVVKINIDLGKLVDYRQYWYGILTAGTTRKETSNQSREFNRKFTGRSKVTQRKYEKSSSSVIVKRTPNLAVIQPYNKRHTDLLQYMRDCGEHVFVWSDWHNVVGIARGKQYLVKRTVDTLHFDRTTVTTHRIPNELADMRRSDKTGNIKVFYNDSKVAMTQANKCDRITMSWQHTNNSGSSIYLQQSPSHADSYAI